MKTHLQKLFGRIGLAFGFCPECNSDAPEMYKCLVCEGYNNHNHKDDLHPFPPTKETKQRWWRRFTMARCQHGRPMEDTNCPECREMFRGFSNSHRNAKDPRRG